MLDLLMILIPAVLMIVGIGWWIVKDMTLASRAVGKFLMSAIAISVAGIIVLSFFGGVGVMIAALVILGYKLYKRRPV
ncbi:MAG: hypothetical protein GY799_26690 [Desulfobulbaceae bacterium]|nr:hypothetical protein [Desulfobulbaceae bacterium]